MKKGHLFLLFFLGSFSLAKAQSLPDEFKLATKVYFYGIDFTEVRAFGEGFENPQDIITRYFPDMNAYYVERKDYNCMADLFGKEKSILYEGTEVINHIRSIDPATLVSYSARDYKRLDSSAVTKIVNTYQKTTDGSFGFIIIAEDLNKIEEYASVWPTIFNCNTGEIIYTARYEGGPSGFGLKRYWLGAVDDAICKFGKDIKKMMKEKRKRIK